MKICPFNTGRKDANKKDGDQNANDEINHFSKDNTRVRFEEFFNLFIHPYDISCVLFLYLLSFFCNLVTLMFITVTRNHNGDKNDTDENGKQDNGNPHIW